MKGTVFSALLLGAQIAAAASPHIYIFDPSTQSHPTTHSRTVTPVAGRLVLAQRVGVEDFHGEALATVGVVDAVNDFGVRTHLFDGGSKAPKRALIYLEGDTEPANLGKDTRSVEVSPAPETSANRGLFLDLARQAHPAISKLSDEELFEYIREGKDTKFGAFRVANSEEEFEQLFAQLSEAGEIVTGLFSPLIAGPNKESWGTYEMPGQEPLLQKRRAQAEAPLGAEHVQSVANSTQSSRPLSSLAETTPLAGNFPSCFSSAEECEKLTKGCNGHGECDKKFTDPDKPDKSPAKNCFACVCIDTKDPKSGVTTKWGGSACQKKDISVEFWLIALFSVGMIFVISFAVGSIWSMGNEELPSVIGAGVSGPVKRS